MPSKDATDGPPVCKLDGAPASGERHPSGVNTKISRGKMWILLLLTIKTWNHEDVDAMASGFAWKFR